MVRAGGEMDRPPRDGLLSLGRLSSSLDCAGLPMPGLDQRIIAQIDHESVIAHVKADIRSDFILAPHYNSIFNRAGDELWDQLKQQLRAGTYQPELPITMSVPKERFFTRPGSILRPADRLMYQALVDNVMEELVV
jgi:hypothetical protein